MRPDITQYDFEPLSEGQKLMLADGCPPCLLLSKEQRALAWINKRPRPLASYVPAKEVKTDDPGTIKFRAELEARAKAEAKQRKRAAKEAAIIKARQLAKPQETDMAKAGPKELQRRALREQRHAETTGTATAAPEPNKPAAPAKETTVKTKTKAAKPAAKKSAKKAATTTRRQKPARSASAARPAAQPKEGGVREGSKLSIIVGLLKRPGGCTTADVLKATGWPAVSMPQQAKAAGLELKKEKVDGKTVYSAA